MKLLVSIDFVIGLVLYSIYVMYEKEVTDSFRELLLVVVSIDFVTDSDTGSLSCEPVRFSASV